MAVDDVKERLKAIEMAVGQIEKQFGKVANQQVTQAGVVIDDKDVLVLFVHAGKDKGGQ